MGLHRSSEATLIHVVVTVVTLAAGVAAVFPTVEFWFNAVGVVLLGVGALWIVVALVRRELRIRRRLAAIRAEAPPVVAPKSWNREAA